MNRLYPFIYLLLYTSIVFSQNSSIWGVAAGSGDEGNGTIYNLNVGLSNGSFRPFPSATGNDPYGGIVLDNDKNIYGMTLDGGNNGGGVIFKYDMKTDHYTVLHDFIGNTGSDSFGGLLIDNNGNLFGIARLFHSQLYSGVVFEYNLTTNIYSVKAFIDRGEIGFYPGNLFQASNGHFYGFTFQGSDSSLGSFFEYNDSTNLIRKITAFNSNTGHLINQGLIERNGKLYGATDNYSDNNYTGVIIEYDLILDSVKITTALPIGDVSNIILRNNNIVGLTNNIVYSYDVSSDSLYLLDTLPSGLYGRPIILEHANKLYGTFRSGNGNRDGGEFFEYDFQSDTSKLLFNYNRTDGQSPQNGLAYDSSGSSIIGVTIGGGLYNLGGIYSYNPISHTYKNKFMFTEPNFGRGPIAKPIFGNDGNLYGLTNQGGPNGLGVLYKFDPVLRKFISGVSLDTISGSNPSGHLVQANNGKMYGATRYSLENIHGALIEYDPSLNRISRAHKFQGGRWRRTYGFND